jgi:hypothetical protein
MRGSSVVVRDSLWTALFFLNSIFQYGVWVSRKFDSVFDMEYDPPGAKPKGVYQYY